MTLRTTLVLIVTLSCATASVAQSSTQFTSLTAPSAPSRRSFSANERHIQSETLGTLYANSAFAHGYRHGYEQGFHIGDLDVHMGRNARVVMNLRDYGQPSREYHPRFGSKQLFHEGYGAGLRSGYADAISGAEFRVTIREKIAAAGLTDVLPNTRRAHFDDGFAAGYNSAQSQNAPVVHVNAEYVERYCRQTRTDLYSLEYCSGFGRGYMLGISGSSLDPGRITASERVAR